MSDAVVATADSDSKDINNLYDFGERLNEATNKSQYYFSNVTKFDIPVHYKWALDELFYKRNFSKVVVLEDDMEIAPDFFEFFEAAVNLLDKDWHASHSLIIIEVKSGANGFTIKMRDGKLMKCVHNSPQGGHLTDCAAHPAIVLKMEDGNGLLLPLIVLEMPTLLLRAAIQNVHIASPAMYHVIKEMVEKMGYAVKVVRVTKRVHEAYFAQIYLTKVDNEAECISFDLRPSDARCALLVCHLALNGTNLVSPVKASYLCHQISVVMENLL